ncbi:MAG: NlpC/P60 family protein [Ruminococcus sp.]|jgi:cell wall-associated NlpC family hydrolase
MRKERITKMISVLTLTLAISLLITVPVQAAGWQKSDAGWRYENENGGWPENEWKLIGNQWYYFNGAGYRVSGWQQIDGGWYYFGEEKDGSLETSAWVDDYYVGSDGRMMKGAWIGNYYVDEEGKRSDGVRRTKGIPLEAITLSKTEIVLQKGEAANLYVSCQPEDTTDFRRISWKSSDSSVASVSSGKIVAREAGTARITARIGLCTAGCTVTVYDSPVCRTAMSLIGDQYIWGGNGPQDGGVDCSGLLMYAYTQNGYDFGADLNADNFGKYGREITREELRPGDAVCCVFGNGKYQHILLYLGNDMVIASESGGAAVCTAGLECFQHERGTTCNCRVVKRPLNENDLKDAKFVRMDAFKRNGVDAA